MRKIPFAGIELTSQRVRRLRGADWATGVDRLAMGPLKYKKKKHFRGKLFLYFLFCRCPASLKFENKVHLVLGTSNWKWCPPWGTSDPQRQVLYSASKDMNSSSVGRLCFFVATYRNDLIFRRVATKKTQTYKKKWNVSVFLLPERALPTKMISGNLFHFCFLGVPPHY